MRKYLLAAAALIFLSPGGCSTQADPSGKAETSLFAMNTYMTFTAYGDNAKETLDRSVKKIEYLESLWSVTDEESEIYRANHSQGEPVKVSRETADLLSFTLDMAGEMDGALDPTIYPVLTAWGFTTDTKQVPSQEEIEELLPLVDYRKISLEGDLLTVPAGMNMDLGAVGKGCAADLVTEELREQGVESALISLGGNIQAVGDRPDESLWRIGLSDPEGEGNIGVLEISDEAVVTSGSSENYFEDEDGNIYWHILDPATGYPASEELKSVTVISREGRRSDALSTGLFVMGAREAQDYWRENGGFEMILLTSRGEIILTEGIEEKFTLNERRGESVRVIYR